FQVHPGPRGGGWGATSTADGESAVICINDGDTHNTPVEALEAKYPMLRVDRYSLREDSGGAGTWRGGLGTETAMRFVGPANASASIERHRCAPWGLNGGLSGQANSVITSQEQT